MGRVDLKNNLCCPTHDWSYMPQTLEEKVRNGTISLVFGNRLFQQGCADHNCEYIIDPCRAVGLLKAPVRTDMTGLQAASEKLVQSLETLDQAESWEDLTQTNFEVSAISNSAGYSEAMALFRSLAIMETVPRSITGPSCRNTRRNRTSCVARSFVSQVSEKSSRVFNAAHNRPPNPHPSRAGVENYCPHQHWDHLNNRVNPDWEADVCCNHALQETMCCAPQDIDGDMVEAVVGVDEGALRTYCRHPNQVLWLLQDFQTNLEGAEQCSADMESDVGQDALNSLWEFKEACKQQVGMGQHYERPECEARGYLGTARAVLWALCFGRSPMCRRAALSCRSQPPPRPLTRAGGPRLLLLASEVRSRREHQEVQHTVRPLWRGTLRRPTLRPAPVSHAPLRLSRPRASYRPPPRSVLPNAFKAWRTRRSCAS